MKSRVLLIISAVAVVAMCVFIFMMSAFPAKDSDALSTGLIWHIVGFIVPGYDQLSTAEQLQWQEALQFPVRKTAHFLEYALLGALVMNLVMRVNALRAQPLHVMQAAQASQSKSTPLARQALIAWAFSTAYAITDEVHQMFVPGRSGELRDIGIDAAGSLLGVLIVLLVARLVGKARFRKAAAMATETAETAETAAATTATAAAAATASALAVAATEAVAAAAATTATEAAETAATAATEAAAGKQGNG